VTIHRAITAVGVVAMAKVAYVLLELLLFVLDGGTPDRWSLRMLLFTVTYAVTGGVLVRGGQRDERAAVLGVTFLVVATAFGDSLAELADPRRYAIAPLVTAAFAVHLDALAPPLMLLFASRFPRLLESRGRAGVDRVLLTLTLIGALALIGVNLAEHLRAATIRPERGVWYRWSRHNPDGLYWPVQFALILVGLGRLTSRLHDATPDDRRRGEALIWGVVLGAAPIVCYVLLRGLFPSINQTLPPERVAWLVYASLLAIPIVTAWAVRARGALDVAVVVRLAARYLMARGVLVACAAVPTLLLVRILFQQRYESIAVVVSRGDVRGLTTMTVVASLLLRGRRGLLQRLDRRFFRERYDASVTLTALVARCRDARDPEALARALHDEVTGALQPQRVVLLLLTGSGQLVSSDRSVRPLGGDTTLLPHDPDVAVSRWDRASAAALATLTEDERLWLVDYSVALVWALRSPGGALCGALVLGEKRSELPYTREDLDLVAAVVHAAEMSLALTAHQRGSEELASVEMAHECVTCGHVQTVTSVGCHDCASPLVPSGLPILLNGKFALQYRLGEGAMGVVYRARDVELARDVAIKTLPRLSADRVVQLRREARTVAAVAHPNLATILTAESWRGQPLLVFELLAGGTLADRLRQGRLPLRTVVDLGLQLADALVTLHDASILHRDIKPSNIGFTSDGSPKLLDFGLAHLLLERDTPLPEAGRLVAAVTAERNEWATSSTLITGTPAYMSPEALAGQPPSAQFDLWSLSVVLVEALTGIVTSATGAPDCWAPTSPDEHTQSVDADARARFRTLLHPDPARRPQTARELRAWLLRSSERATP
jgi:hypothetical protein